MSQDSTEELPRIARYKPYYAELEAGKTYFWCACGLSQNQPYCDGSHQGTPFLPVKFTAEIDEEVLFCGCKRTTQPPFCDGSHNNLKDTYDTDDPDSPENQTIPIVKAGEDGRAHLNGHCFVADVSALPHQLQGALKWTAVVTRAQGAQYQSLFHLELPGGESPVIQFSGSEAILLVTNGKGNINISSQLFDIKKEVGIYVRPGESFLLNNTGSEPLSLYAAVCPQAAVPEFPEALNSNFDHDQPQRCVGIDPEKRQSMADRFFQMLVDKNVGSTVVTQFIGEIPLSKAVPHRHLYEETLVILSGHGYMWTEDKKARVNPGNIIFLPRKQLHSLECTDPQGMMVAGVIYPGDNPSVNY